MATALEVSQWLNVLLSFLVLALGLKWGALKLKLRQFGKLWTVIADALEDDRITEDEIAQILQALSDLLGPFMPVQRYLARHPRPVSYGLRFKSIKEWDRIDWTAFVLLIAAIGVAIYFVQLAF